MVYMGYFFVCSFFLWFPSSYIQHHDISEILEFGIYNLGDIQHHGINRYGEKSSAQIVKIQQGRRKIRQSDGERDSRRSLLLYIVKRKTNCP